jgi:hypothetical protein
MLLKLSGELFTITNQVQLFEKSKKVKAVSMLAKEITKLK